MKYVLIGFALCLVFFLWTGLVVYIGYRQGQKKKAPAEPLSLDEKLRLERIQKGFNSVMSYDINKALGVKHE